MKIEESVPKITPRIMAKAKLRMLAPPRMKIHSNTINVEIEVLTVRARVWLILSLNNDCLSCFFG